MLRRLRRGAVGPIAGGPADFGFIEKER